MELLKDHVVLVTGGGSGLGLGIARECLSQGAQVAVLDHSAEKVKALPEELGAGVLGLHADASRCTDMVRARGELLDRFGRLDALICAQGIFDGNVPLQDLTLDRIDTLFDEIFHVNVKSHVIAAHVFGEDLRASNGSILLTTSTAAYAADGGGVMYTASKGAVRSLVGQLAFEFAPTVRVNGVAPAGIANSRLSGPRALGLDGQSQADIPKDAFLRLFRSLSLLQELPSGEDYAPLYAFLASHHNRIVTGQVMVADQGLLNRAALSGKTS